MTAPAAPRVIPAIDLLDGKAVRLRRGSFEEVTVYPEPPEALAERWRALVDQLHVVDLEGARQGQVVESQRIARIVRAFGRGVQVGGGIRSRETIEAYLDLGVERVVLGTAALKDPDLVSDAALAHPGRLVVAVDANQGLVASEGWLEQSKRRAIDLVLDLESLPIAAVLYTDIQRDGMGVGPNIPETIRLARETGASVIASGGVGTLEHLREIRRAALELPGPGLVVGTIVGRALHEERFSLEAAVIAAREVQ